jgi:rod shape-determining protein MreC
MSYRKQHVWIFILASAALAILIGFKPAYGWRLRAWLSPEGEAQTTDQISLAADNASLRLQLTALQSGQSAASNTNTADGIHAMVYSSYPFGFKSQIVLNAGSDAGIQIGKAVTYQGIFIGTVQSVFPDSAVVQTIFDPSFKTPVRIGSQGIDALLVGGSFPKATSISKSVTVTNGDNVYTAASGLPYHLLVGTVAQMSASADDVFKEAGLNFSYDLMDIQSVLVER